MTLHILFHQVISVIMSASSSATGKYMAMPNCPSMCGNVTIPYPFGIGKGCYHDEWYAITCNNSLRPNKPFLSKFNMELLEVSLTAQALTVMNSVASNCGGQRKGKTIWSSTNFTVSPYAFDSFYYNKFVVVGCDPAQLVNYNEEITIGCFSSCEPNASIEGCRGINCCQSSITSHYPETTMPFYNISIEENTTIGCTYAFLGKYDINESYFITRNFMNNAKQVPVVLTWELENLDTNSYCRRSSSGYYCECPDAHTGNPYIPNGCKIVEACANCERNCQRTLTTQGVKDSRCNHTQGPQLICEEIPRTDYQYRCSNKREIILGSSLGGGLFFLLLCGFCCWLYKQIKKKRIANLKKKFFKRNGGLLLEQQISSVEGTANRTILFTADELLKATDNYNENRILGQGGQGTVYKGMLTDGRITAVKKSKLINESQVEQFINEVVILSQINHRNIVKLLGCCLETEVPLLVYEFVVNGTLFDLIHNENEEFLHSWKMRLQIATEVAGALAHLHSASSIPIYHRDIKSTNILLDEKFRAKIADFGTSRSITIEQTHLTTIVYGTFGYLDPEYFRSGQYTDKSDVYSFGVVLAELLTGTKAVSLNESEEHRGLAAHFISYTEQMRVFDILDARILKEAPKEEILVVADIARRCLNLNRRKRPTMKEVTTDLEVMSREPISATTILNQETFNIEMKRNRLADNYSASTMIMSDYIAFPSSETDPLIFYSH